MADETLEVELLLDDHQYHRRLSAVDRATRGMGSASVLTGGNVGGLMSTFRTGVPVLEGIVTAFQTLAVAIAGAGTAYVGFAAYASNSAASFESLKLGLMAYAGSIEETERQLKRLEQVARMPGLGYREAVETSTRLQAVGFSAGLAERAMMAFGNALATVGKGKSDLDGVVMALSQIVSKGVVSAEEINQLAERLPQIRTAMMSAFGTASTEAIQKMGISAETFVTKMIAAFEKLPKAQGGFRNSIENLGDAFDRVVISFGQKINEYLGPTIDKLSQFLENIASSGAMAKVGESLNMAVEKIASTFGANGLGDLMVKSASMALAIIENIPSIVESVIRVTESFVSQLAAFIDTIIGNINIVIEKVQRFVPGMGAIQQIPLIGKAMGDSTLGGQIMNALGPVVGEIGNRYREIYAGMAGTMGENGEFVPDAGGFTTSFGKGAQTPLLKQIADNTKVVADKIQDLMVGGGAATEAAFNSTNIGKWSGGGGSKGAHLILQGVQMLQGEAMVAAARNRSFNPQSR